MESKAHKHDAGKPPMRYLGMLRTPLAEVAAVLDFGRKKYPMSGDANWRKVEDGCNRFLSAAVRHILARCDGEACDAETGRSHLAHAACCVLFALWFDLQTEVPDLQKPGPV